MRDLDLACTAVADMSNTLKGTTEKNVTIERLTHQLGESEFTRHTAEQAVQAAAGLHEEVSRLWEDLLVRNETIQTLQHDLRVRNDTIRAMERALEHVATKLGQYEKESARGGEVKNLQNRLKEVEVTYSSQRGLGLFMMRSPNPVL